MSHLRPCINCFLCKGAPRDRRTVQRHAEIHRDVGLDIFRNPLDLPDLDEKVSSSQQVDGHDASGDVGLTMHMVELPDMESHASNEHTTQSTFVPMEQVPLTPQVCFRFELLEWQFRFRVSDSGLGQMLQLLNRFDVRVEGGRNTLPSSVHSLYSDLDLHQDDTFKSFAVCTECFKLHEIAVAPLVCKAIMFNGDACKGKVRQQSNILRTYVLNDIGRKLGDMFARPGFWNLIEHWRNKPVDSDMSDIYDAAVWQQFQTVNGQAFLNEPGNVGLVLNVDWYQPYENASYSVGAMYLAILNLPLAVRYKPENVVVVGLMPGPKEPSMTMNTFLKPIVDQLLLLWDTGLSVGVADINTFATIRAALMCTTCDIPATRKVG